MLSLEELAGLLPAIRAAAEQASAAILRHYEAGTQVTEKADGSPVTAADEDADAIILAALRDLTPTIPVVTEEEVAAGRIPDISAGTFWLVDPLDGTKEFIKRNGEFTVNIALIQGGEPALGVVMLPVGGTIYAAAGPGTAVRGRPGAADEPIQVRAVPAAGLTVLTSRSHADNAAVDEFLTGRRVAARVAAGSSLKFCRVAEGVGDVYPRLGPTCEWDIAAGHAVLIGAGGCLSLLDGEPFPYGKAPTFLNPHFVAWGGA
ncbi:3'(2'),5'-bisphosphate nucleotidase CysQ [Niveispirillum sp.]|uniref:3'(2'),5'-bisphosphate nucleotidase CysQ n=1 Tax=Niveispirillum sp. TaxID=1917217 RepID=UPI001B59BFEE|nr:3'(2'),5'-bisphosphate nucleotidase CysQ [Niveispirillum sp.]MBP7336596.1 3'(2'),5'-bisphosphate nucleotidase CysQ [Niveispirillum sp.]